MLMLYSGDDEVINRVYTKLLHYMDIVKTVLPSPTQQQLLEYTTENLERMFGPVSEEIKAYFVSYYAKSNLGYDTVDYLIRYLKLSGFNGRLEEIKKVLESLGTKSSTDYHRIGF